MQLHQDSRLRLGEGAKHTDKYAHHGNSKKQYFSRLLAWYWVSVIQLYNTAGNISRFKQAEYTLI